MAGAVDLAAIQARNEAAARAVLEQCQFHVKTAIVALKKNIGVAEALALLETSHGSVRQALG